MLSRFGRQNILDHDRFPCNEKWWLKLKDNFVNIPTWVQEIRSRCGPVEGMGTLPFPYQISIRSWCLLWRSSEQAIAKVKTKRRIKVNRDQGTRMTERYRNMSCRLFCHCTTSCPLNRRKTKMSRRNSDGNTCDRLQYIPVDFIAGGVRSQNRGSAFVPFWSITVTREYPLRIPILFKVTFQGRFSHYIWKFYRRNFFATRRLQFGRHSVSVVMFKSWWHVMVTGARWIPMLHNPTKLLLAVSVA